MVETKNEILCNDSYKDSGISWLGEIPENWGIESFKNILTERNEKNTPIKTKEILSLSINKGVTLYAEKTTNLDRFKDDFSKYKLAHKDDLVFNSMNMIVGAVGVSDYFGCVSPVYYTYYSDLKNLNSSKFYEYLFRSKIVQGVLYSLGKGLMAIDRGDGKYNTLRLKVSRDDLRSMKLPLPNPSEQSKIVQFLDDKTDKINQAIAIKEQQINLLKERKQILIHKAVTRGLNDNVVLKDSGVDWIGEIPEHWEVKRFKFLCDITTGSKNTQDKIENGLYPFYVRSQTPEKINTYTFDGEAILTAGDGAGVGKVFHYLNEKFDFHQRVYKFSNFRNIKGKLLFYFLRSNFHSVALNGEAKSTVDSLRLPLIQNFMVTIPPKREQIEIIDRIETASQKIETAIGLKQQEITKLKEYKSSLINSVVTGKVKVC